MLDPNTARWLFTNLSRVHVPVNADIPEDISIHFVDEFDPQAGEIGGKGIGELGATGVDAAVAEAVEDAVGVRLRELPAGCGIATSGSDRGRGCAPLELCAFLPFWVDVSAHDAVHGAFGPDVVEASVLE